MVVDMVKQEQLAQILKALADPTRLQILAMLKRPGCCSMGPKGGLCACDIEGQLKLSQPTISHHMKVLREAGLVDAEKIGQWMWYRRNEAAMKRLAKTMESGV